MIPPLRALVHIRIRFPNENALIDDCAAAESAGKKDLPRRTGHQFEGNDPEKPDSEGRSSFDLGSGAVAR
jgi:hypothetical protein